VNRQVFGFVALDDVLRPLFRSVVGVTLKSRVRSDFFDDGSGYDARFRIPSNVVADLEWFHSMYAGTSKSV
jgi:hypothetical protein